MLLRDSKGFYLLRSQITLQQCLYLGNTKKYFKTHTKKAQKYFTHSNALQNVSQRPTQLPAKLLILYPPPTNTFPFIHNYLEFKTQTRITQGLNIMIGSIIFESYYMCFRTSVADSSYKPVVQIYQQQNLTSFIQNLGKNNKIFRPKEYSISKIMPNANIFCQNFVLTKVK